MPRKIPQGLKKKVKNLIADGVIDRETVKKVKQANTARKIEFEIGDSKQDDFFPQFKTKHWDNEVNFSARLVAGQGTVTEHEGKLAYDDGEQIARFYEKDTGDEDGGFEFDVVLPKKPKSNVIRWSIQHKELDFFYQPELTEEEIAEGGERPENVAGSYAVYHKTKKNNKVGGKEYRTGKAFHIYRPYAEDANGDRVWADLNIDTDTDEMTVTIDQKWLDKAAYPVIVDPTFGYTTVGGTTNAPSNGVFIGSKHTSPSDVGDVTDIYVYAGAGFFGEANGVVVLDANKTIVGSETGQEAGNWTSANWRQLAYETSPTLTPSTDYILGVTKGGTANFRYDTGASGDGWLDTSNNETGITDPTDGSSTDRIWSIYANYTASGGGGRRRIIIT